MFKYLRVKSKPDTVEPTPGSLSEAWLAGDSEAPIRLGQLNNLPEKTKRRIYRGLLPAWLLVRYGIDPVTWKGQDGNEYVWLKALPESEVVQVSVRKSAALADEFFHLELADNAFGGIDLNFIILNDPDSPRFDTDIDEQGNPTLFGTINRNRAAEECAMAAGLAPGQVRSSLGASQATLQQLEIFLGTLGQRAYFLEPLTYVSAWVFERRGLAYMRGHKLMDDIHSEFQPGGRLYRALDDSTPFRKAEQWRTVRGRAWAIHDGILEAIDAHWDKLRMVKQIGKLAEVETFPGAVY